MAAIRAGVQFTKYLDFQELLLKEWFQRNWICIGGCKNCFLCQQFSIKDRCLPCCVILISSSEQDLVTGVAKLFTQEKNFNNSMMEGSHSEMNGVADRNHSESTSEQDSLINSSTTELEGTTLRHRLDPEPKREEDEDGSKQAHRVSNKKTSQDRRKLEEMRKVLRTDPIDVTALRRFAISHGGLLNKSIRQKAWPLLISANTSDITPKPSQQEMEALTKTYSQVCLDVNRSSSRFPPGIDDYVRMSMKDKLVDLIMRVMLKRRQLKYYQGFHDVCITFLLCMDEDVAFAMVDKLAMGHMREYLDETMERTSLMLNYVYPLIRKCNPALCEFMEKNNLGTIFALAWVITWFSHVLGDIKHILRVFDFFLASHRLMPVYLSAAFVLYREQDMYNAGDDMGFIHKCLCTIPEDLPIESLLEKAGDLYLQYPPSEISRDPMLLRMNKDVYNHFDRINNRASMRRAQSQSDVGSRLFVRATMWTVTAVVGVAAAVIYHAYSSNSWNLVGDWSPFS